MRICRARSFFSHLHHPPSLMTAPSMYQQVSTGSIYQLPRCTLWQAWIATPYVEAKIVVSPCSGITQKTLVLGSRNQGNLSIAKLSHDLGILNIISKDFRSLARWL